VVVRRTSAPIAPVDRRLEDRDIEAAANAVRSFLAPDVIAVIGASRDPGAIGGRLF
jgi:hypothetical protein